ncbi:hypothetical protein QWY14_03040 [Planococcus sp. N028]|uniref:Uncharacterized protein n=1 Tax=Planococcus shixiaomingii TaxID=3058393 RepID=A0ABT8MYS9_9BACL|nr:MULTISPECIES: hypothetical protein [unclassified Planococcus (in: firmicutes)]MDN7240745.1 hypothetical protein [Planococcus sp. N028]WKA56652.1 hypothetical protein QWY21_09985 [Planococcus sp. N022]
MKFCIVGNDTEMAIEVFTQSYPESTDYWAGNWLNAKIECEIPGFSVKFDFQLRTDELKDFADQLKVMEQHLSGKAALYNLDGYVEIEGTMNPLGDVEWAVTLCYPAGIGAALTFKFHSDQQALQQLTKQLDKIVSIFPVVGAL